MLEMFFELNGLEKALLVFTVWVTVWLNLYTFAYALARGWRDGER